MADKDSFKTGYLEGYMLGKDETKKSDRFKGWTTVLIFGVLAYLYVKMVSVFGKLIQQYTVVGSVFVFANLFGKK